MAREAPIIRLSWEEFQQLQQWVNARATPQGLAFRARIILRCDQAGQRAVPRNEDIAAELGCDPNTVSRWRRRFRDQRLDGLFDRPRSGRPRAFSP
jgi:transposase